MERRQNRLVKEATLSEINKYNLSDGKLHVYETDKRTAPKLKSKKRPQNRHTAVLE
jgi:hypothetical protein